MSTQRTHVRKKQYDMPFVRMELAVFSVMENTLRVLLVQREEDPFAGQWALPGGVLRIDLDIDLDAAAQRVGQERLGVPMPWLRQQIAVGGVGRDPRAPWALSVVYRALVPDGLLAPRAGKRIQDVRWVPVHEAAEDNSLAFAHSSLIAGALNALREEIDRLELPASFLPERFTLAELQRWCEVLSRRKLDKSSFRRRLAAQSVVRPIEGELELGKANRPAQLYELMMNR
jgi:8-oxo-dGTP diphosphatase